MTSHRCGIVFDLNAPDGSDPKRLLALMHCIGPALVHVAMKLGITSGCRIQDDKAGLDFRWRLLG